MAEICVQRIYVITKECFLREPISHEGFISVMYLDSQNNTRRIVKEKKFPEQGKLNEYAMRDVFCHIE